MSPDQQDQKDRSLRGEKAWRDLSPAQRRGVALGYSMIASALLVGASQPSFNRLCLLALFMVASGLLTVLVALSSR